MISSNVSRTEAVNRMHEAHERMEKFGGKHRLSRADQAEFDALAEEFEDFAAHVKRIDKSAEMIAGVRSGRYQLQSGTPFDGGHAPTGQRDGALRTLDEAVRTNRLPAHGAEVVENLLHTGTPLAQTWAQRYTVAAGSEHYERAFAKMAADPARGHLLWTEPEADAWRAVAAVAAEERAMNLTDSAGGFLAPLVVDPAVLLTSAGSTNPLRQISRVVTTVSDAWQGITSAGVTAEWLAEAAQAADASPTLGQPSIPVYKASAFVPYSYEVGDDATNFMQELGKLLVDGYEQLTATAYAVGSGSGQPTGVISSLVASSGTVALITPGVAETLAAGDVYSVQNALPPRFQPNAQWCANLAILNTLRQLETTNGALRFPELRDNPPRLLGRAANEVSNMDGTINAAASENNYPLLYGDFSNFVIVDRIGSRIELIPNLVGANHRPTGQRGAFLWARTGSNVVVPQAFRLLSIATTA